MSLRIPNVKKILELLTSGRVLTNGGGSGGASGHIRIPRSVPAPWTPFTEGGVRLLLIGGVGITQNSGFVERWADQSGNGNDAVQAVHANQPVTGTSIRSRPTVEFDGLTSFMVLPPNIAGMGGAATMAIVSRLNTPPGVYAALTFNSGASTSILYFMALGGYTNTTTGISLTGAANGVGYDDVLGTSPTRKVFTFDGTNPASPAAYSASIDGVPEIVIASGALNAPTPTMHAIGSDSSLAPSSPFDGGMRVIVLFDHVLSPAALAKLDAWLVSQGG